MEKGNIIMMIGGIIVLIIGLGWGILELVLEPITSDLFKMVFQSFGVITILIGISFGCLLIGSALFKYK